MLGVYFCDIPFEQSNSLLNIRLGPDVLRRDIFEATDKPSQDKYQEVTWYHEGPESLRVARKDIAGMYLLFEINLLHVCHNLGFYFCIVTTVVYLYRLFFTKSPD